MASSGPGSPALPEAPSPRRWWVCTRPDGPGLPAQARWDVVYCSNAIEHMEDPRAFIQAVLEHTGSHAVFMAPWCEEAPMSLDHRSRIDEGTFEGFDVESLQLLHSAAWPATADGRHRQQVLAVLRPKG